VPGAGAVVGRFLRALHAFPVEHAAALGLTNPSPDGFRAQRADFYAKVQALVLPRVDEITAAYTMQRFEAFLNDPASFDWMPCVSHADIDARNVLADPDTGEITGVIDWGDIRIGDPAGEFTGILFAGLGRAGLLNQLPALIGGYGMTPGELERVQERCRFYYFCWPLNEAIHGIEHDKADFIESGLEWLCRLAREGGA
jgi:aminoglycoside 2''-phosphotransferase